MLPKSTHVAANGKTLFCFMAELYSIVWNEIEDLKHL